MKKVYETPVAEKIDFLTQDVLAVSGDFPLVDDNDKGGSVTEFGPIQIF